MFARVSALTAVVFVMLVSPVWAHTGRLSHLSLQRGSLATHTGGRHAKAHRAASGCTYWPALEECLTPQEGREVEAAVMEELNEVADS